MFILETHQLSKSFGGKAVVSDVNLSVKKGEIYGFLGQNGAGKTTIMKMITNLVRPTSGEITLFGEKLTANSAKVMAKLGSIIEYPTLYGHLSARETLQLHCNYMGFRCQPSGIQEALELVGLQNASNKPVSQFSLGMKQRLGLARAIVTKPELLLLDEPINGLDPIGIQEMRGIFKTLQQQYGMTLFISSHILGEVELIADKVAIIRNGNLVEEIEVNQLHGMSSGEIMITCNSAQLAAEILSDKLSINQCEIVDERQLKVYSSSVAEHLINRTLVYHDIDVSEISKTSYSLEQYFMERMNGGAAYA